MNNVKIKVVGPKNPCKRCRTTKSRVKEVVNKHLSSDKKENIKITHVDVSAPETIQSYGVLDTPAVVINDTVVSEGEIPEKDYIKRKLEELLE